MLFTKKGSNINLGKSVDIIPVPKVSELKKTKYLAIKINIPFEN